MKYFEGLTEEKEIKERYRKLAKEHHPDRGGDAQIMIMITAQYEEVLRGHYQKAGKSLTEIEELLNMDFAVAQKIREIILLENVMVELCGSWIWLSGETKASKERIKQAGFNWSQPKKMWYWRPQKEKFRRWGKSYSMDEIRFRHGSNVVTANKNFALC